MNVSSVLSVPTKIMDKMPSNSKAFKPIQKQIANGDVFLSSSKKSSGFRKILKSLMVAGAAMAATSCATLKGGNFIYNDMYGRVESYDDSFDIQNNKNAEETKDINLGNIEDKYDFKLTKTNKDNLRNIYDKEFFKSIDVDKWVKENEDKLVGSCLFEQGTNLAAKITLACTKNKNCTHEYTPSHGTPIYKDEDGTLMIMQIKPPRNFKENLVDYLKNSEKDFAIYLRDFDIDSEKFSESVKQFDGQKYGLVSAMQSVLSSINVDGGTHCSECYMKEIQKYGHFKNIDANKITPHTLMHLLVNSNKSPKA